MDDIQYNRHIEMTLRKVGFEVESVNNEFSINEPLLSFNPDYIICRGNSSRLNVLNVGKKLKESGTRYNGKVVLVLPENFTVPPEELFKLKADLLLHDPISTLRLVVQLISLTTNDIEFIKDKLLKFAITDNQFRNYEQQILKNAGLTIDSEIQVISSLEGPVDFGGVFVQKGEPEPETGAVVIKGEDPGDGTVSQDVKTRLSSEIKAVANEMPLRIDTYNRAISKVDQDLKKGHKKRQTRKEVNQLHKDLIAEQKTDKQSEQQQDNERIRFTNALFKKKQE
jgi:hypothetical protein